MYEETSPCNGKGCEKGIRKGVYGKRKLGQKQEGDAAVQGGRKESNECTWERERVFTSCFDVIF